MPIKYILNQIQKHKGFVYGQARLIKRVTRWILEIDIQSSAEQPSHLFRL